ncbi:hypothetical protein BDZ88DRAFT_442937 [Geranomyces variabilis]|nr:hypothetical protein BDZ88DRAFT_442937 [Geranomyces variabilis]
MATFTPPALPAGHWAAAAGFPAAPTPLNMAVYKWGEAHAAHHNALQRADTDMGSGSFTTYDYIAYRNLTANYCLTIASLALQDSLEDYIQSFQRLLQQEDMAVQINGDLMERSSKLAKRTQWFRDGIARNLRMGPHILAAIQQVILHHATVNSGHATMDQIYNAARTALSASGIADGAATGQMPIAPVPQQRPAPIPFARPSARYEPYGFTPQPFASRPFYRPVMPSALTPRPMRMLPSATPRYQPVNSGHATMDQIYNAARTALSASGIADGAATGQMPIAPVPQQRPAPAPPYTKTHANVAFSDSTLPTWYSREDAVAPSYLSSNPYSKAAASTPNACKDSPDAPHNTSTSCPNSAATSWTKNAKCWAKKTVDGESLETANMAYSVGQSVNTEQDLMDVQHDYDQYDAQCQDDEDPNYMAEAMQEIEQEDFLSTWQ